MDKPRLLFINPGQFGYKTGSYYYCKYLREFFRIQFICFDQELSKMDLEGVEVAYVTHGSNWIFNQYRWFLALYRKLSRKQYDLVFTVFFRFCFLIPLLFPSQKIVLDIRTGSLKDNVLLNWMHMLRIRLSSLLFSSINIISEGLRQKLGIPSRKSHITPLGAERISSTEKSFDELRLLYVGNLFKRNIPETIEGLKVFLDTTNVDSDQISYDIFGFGDEKEKLALIESIEMNDLGDVVTFHGRKNHREIKPYYDQCNVGIAYVPLKDYFEVQPTTKIFEYTLSGLACIATATIENQKLIQPENGVLCHDSPQAFSAALAEVYHKRESYQSHDIRRTMDGHSWQEVVNTSLYPYLNSLLTT